MRFQRTLLVSLFLTLLTSSRAVDPLPTNFVNLFPDGSLFASSEALLIAAGLRQQVANMGGCNVNLCFALDGSGSIFQSEFAMMREFVLFITAILAGNGENAFAATQYGLRNIDISRLTSDADEFLLAVDDAELADAPRTFIAAGLGFCVRELRPRLEDANKVVLFSDGRSNFGGNPVPIAQKFREMYDGDICAVGVGFENTSVLEDIAGSPQRVIAIDDYFALLDIVDQIVAEVCGFDF